MGWLWAPALPAAELPDAISDGFTVVDGADLHGLPRTLSA
jgi:hypothetical protein